MLSIARSRLALITQLLFLGIHSFGLLLGAIYRNNVPDLYENNSHSRVGWVATVVVSVQVIIGLLKLAANYGKAHRMTSEEQKAFLPMKAEALAEQWRRQSPDPYRYSHDSGHFTASDSSRSHSITADYTQEEQRKLQDHDAAIDYASDEDFEKHGILSNAKAVHFAKRVGGLVPKRTVIVLDIIYNLIDRTIFLLGFLTFVTGIAVYGGVFVSSRMSASVLHIKLTTN